VGAIILPMSSSKVLFGFHALGVRLKTAPQSILEIHFEPGRRDARMRSFLDRANEAGVKLVESDGQRLAKLCGGHGHQGVVARVQALAQVHSLDGLLEDLKAANAALPVQPRNPPPIPVLDGGHIMFLLFETINGGPLSRRKIEIAQRLGFSLLFFLIFIALFTDIQ